MQVPIGESNIERLREILYMYVPTCTLAYNLHVLNVSKAAEAVQVITFRETKGEVADSQGEVAAVANRAGSSYYLSGVPLHNQYANIASHQTKENLWHQRFGHLGERNLHVSTKLKKGDLVNGFDYDVQRLPESD